MPSSNRQTTTTTTTSLVLFLVLIGTTTTSHAFSSTLFQEQVSQQVTAKTSSLPIELPDFDELFVRIRQTSPLARVALQGGEVHGKRGLKALENTLGTYLCTSVNPQGWLQRWDITSKLCSPSDVFCLFPCRVLNIQLTTSYHGRLSNAIKNDWFIKFKKLSFVVLKIVSLDFRKFRFLLIVKHKQNFFTFILNTQNHDCFDKILLLVLMLNF